MTGVRRPWEVAATGPAGKGVAMPDETIGIIAGLGRARLNGHEFRARAVQRDDVPKLPAISFISAKW